MARTMFEAAGTPPAAAARVAASLVGANLAGHDSHGVIRIPQYVAAIRAGELLPAAQPRVVRDTLSGLLVDGGWTFGQVACSFATDLVVARAQSQGLAAAGVVRCTHTGRLGEYAEQAAAAGSILLVFGGGLTGSPLAAPFGGRAKALGANPLAAGFPVAGGAPMIVDFATTVVAEGKLRVARDRGEQVAPGVILDRAGQPTTDPNDFYNGGMLLPFGGHKGYALALVAELLAASLVGPGDWAEEGRGGRAFGRSGIFFLALSTDVLGTRDAYLQHAAATLGAMRAVPPAPGFSAVVTPGEPERTTAALRRREGVPLAPATWDALLTCASGLGVTAPAADDESGT
jgi:LDH2 family malate/lactate/ureidoglycolate dehydrogenase